MYFEGVVQPEGDDAAAIESIASRFPNGADLGERIVAEIDESFAEDAGSDDPPTFAADVQPWLGERAALFLPDVASDPETGEDPPATAIIETTDPDEARGAIERLAESSSDEASEIDGVQLFVDEGDEAVGVVGDYLVFGPQSDVESVIAVEAGDADGLASRDDFTFDVGDVDGSAALAFSWVDTATVIEQSLDADAAADLEEGEVDELVADAGFDSSAPATFALTATDDSAVIDSSVGISDSYGEDSSELLGDLPAGGFLAVGCTSCLDAVRAAFDYGIEQAAAEDGVSPEDAEGRIEAAFGITPAELADALGGAVLYLDTGPGQALGGAAVIEVTDPEPVIEALEVIPRALVYADVVGVEASPLGPGPASDLEGFMVSSADLPQPLTIASDGERLVVALGEEAAREAFDPTVTLAESGRLDLPEGLEGYEPSAVFDLQAALQALPIAILADPGFEAALPYLEAIGESTAGSRVEGDRVLSRVVVGFD